MADAFTSETYNALCRDAEGYLARGLAEQARELLLKATSLIGTRPRARSLLADACMQLGLWGEAKGQLEALATLEVDNIYTHFRLGQVLEETGELELARDNFNVVLDMNPDHHGARVAMARLEKLDEEEASSGAATHKEGQQIFADQNEADSVFAADNSEGIEELLSTIGIGEKKDVPGVEDLLNSIGINEEKKKEEEQKVDFTAIFGGGQTANKESDQNEDDSPLSSVFGKQDSGDSQLPESNADLDSIFGGGGTTDSTDESEKVSEEEEQPSEITDAAADLNAIFGEKPPEDAEAEEAQEPPAGDEPAPDGGEADLSAIFGGVKEESPAAEEDTESQENQADFAAIFGGETSEGSDNPKEPEAEETPAEEPAAEIAVEVPVPDEPEGETDAADDRAEPDETAEEPQGEEAAEQASEAKPEEEETREADLNAIFGETTGEEPSKEPVAEEEKAQEEPSEEPDAQGEEAGEADLNAIFGGTTESPQTQPTESEEDESQTADLGAIFGGTPQEESEGETTGEETTVEESETEEEKAGEEQADEEAPAEEPETEEEKAGEETAVEDTSAEEPEADEEPAAEETQSEEPVTQEKTTEDEPVEDTVETAISYELLPGDSTSLCVMNIKSGRVRVLRGLVTALSGEAVIEGDIISGSGMVWMGQGSLVPVVVDYAKGMTVRIDRLAVRPAGVESVSAGIDSVPSLRKLEGGNGGSLLMFITGRQKKITVVPGLRIRAGSVLAADPGVSFSREDDDFLAVAGSGKVVVTG